MKKVQCKNCGNIGYTACPNSQLCECGGEFQVVFEENQDRANRRNNKDVSAFDLPNTSQNNA